MNLKMLLIKRIETLNTYVPTFTNLRQIEVLQSKCSNAQLNLIVLSV